MKKVTITIEYAEEEKEPKDLFSSDDPLAEFFSERTGFPVWVSDDPMNTVARGLGVFLEYFDDFVPILESAEDDL